MSSTDSQNLKSPQRAPNLSTRTSSFEAHDPHDPNLSQLATTMMQKTEDYLYGELTSTQEAYRTLEQMNRLTLSKYSDIHRITKNVATTTSKMEAISQTLSPHLHKIDEIERAVLNLEKMAFAIDAYSKKLEAKAKCLTKH
ncbi:biogenesis of lysosome-related organelles complex 1 subunit 2-like [Arctopsyche grandis]|uniref:biogenesis of lysosome-related organelles complex 1 subunit 2-like n=1 Tax=Arctopsyche grandis TaxID=121162 RepID=UPI00406D6472